MTYKEALEEIQSRLAEKQPVDFAQIVTSKMSKKQCKFIQTIQQIIKNCEDNGEFALIAINNEIGAVSC